MTAPIKTAAVTAKSVKKTVKVVPALTTKTPSRPLQVHDAALAEVKVVKKKK